MNYVEQFYSTNIKLRAFEDALAETGFNTDIRHNMKKIFLVYLIKYKTATISCQLNSSLLDIHDKIRHCI